MQRKLLLHAYLFFCVNCFAQQYPFVHYTPKDGLLSSRVRNIYQDSKGRIYFTTQRGLSVYDGARFTNYTMENGLANDMVNCVMELGDDSLWVATNTNTINCLVKGKMKKLVLKDSLAPIINYLCRDDKENLYGAADNGLFVFRENNFINKNFKSKTITKDIYFTRDLTFIWPLRNLRIGLNYNFGKLKEGVSKKKGVNNDDLMGKDSN